MRPASLLCTLFLLPIVVSDGVAQGVWDPDGATFTRPRLLATPTDIARVQADISSDSLYDQHPEFRDIYAALVDDVTRTSVPTDTLSSSSRRANARLAKNLAFVLSVDLRINPDGSIGLLGETQRAELVEKLMLCFDRINPSVDAALNYGEWQWRTKELIDYLAAWDLAVAWGSGRPEIDRAETRLRRFAGDLHAEATREVAGLGFFTLIRNNHALMVCGALGAAGVVLNETESPDPNFRASSWVNTALHRADDLLWRADDRLSEPDVIAGFAEGPHYLRYSMLNLLPFWRGLANVYAVDSIDVSIAGSERRLPHPFTDPAVARLAEWSVGIMDPTGVLPSIEDTFVDEAFPEWALLGDREYLPPITSRFTSLAGSLRSTVDMRANFLAAGTRVDTRITYPFLEVGGFRVFPDAGNAVLEYCTNRRFPTHTNRMHFGVLSEGGRARIEGGGHNQSDAASFYMSFGDRRLALDPGYLSYAQRDRVAGPSNHNMILVDGQGPPSGSVGTVGGADARIVDSWQVGADWGCDDAVTAVSVETSYLGADITRYFIHVDPRAVVIADFITSDEDHTYTWQLHGIDSRNPESGIPDELTFRQVDQTSEWTAGGAGMTATIASTSPSLTLDTARFEHEIGYERTNEHIRLAATTEPTRSTSFLSVIHPFAIGLDAGLDLGKTGFASDGRSTSIWFTPGIARNVWSISTDTLLHPVRGWTSDTDSTTVFTDARLFGGPYADRTLAYTMIDGTIAIMDGDTLLWSDRRNTIAWHWYSIYWIDVAVRKPGRIAVRVPEANWEVRENPDIDAWTPGQGLFVIDVNKPTNIRIEGFTNVESKGKLRDRLDLSRR